MKQIYQTVVDKEKGDCLRAAIASMFDLEIIQVPHFLLFGRRWFIMLWHFLKGLDYDLEVYYRWYKQIHFSRKDLINGCILAQVKSKTFAGTTHVVLTNSKGKVLHDPNPSKAYLGENVIKTNQIEGWYLIKRVKNNRGE